MHTLLIILLLMVIALSIFTNRQSLVEGNSAKKRKKAYKKNVKKKAKTKRDKLKGSRRNIFTTAKERKRIKRKLKRNKNRVNKKLSAERLEFKSLNKRQRNAARIAAQEAELQGKIDDYFDQNFEGRLLDDINFWKTFALTQNTQGMDEWENLDRAGRSELLINTYDDAVRTFT